MGLMLFPYGLMLLYFGSDTISLWLVESSSAEVESGIVVWQWQRQPKVAAGLSVGPK